MNLETKFKDSGSLEEFAVADLLSILYKKKATGMLRIELEQIIKVIYIKDGSISFASSNDTNDRLGEVLIRLNKITKAQLEDAMQRLKPNISLGKMLVQLGYLSGKDLLFGAQKQAETIITSVFSWTKGTFSFIEGPLPKQLVDLKLEMPKIIVQGIVISATREWILKHISSMESIFKFNENAKDFYMELQLPEDVDEVVKKIDGKRTLSELSSYSKLEDFHICKIIAALKILDLVEKIEKVEKTVFNIEELIPDAKAESEPAIISEPELETRPGTPLFETESTPEPDAKEESTPQVTARPTIKTPPELQKEISPPVIPVIPEQKPSTPFPKIATSNEPFKHLIETASSSNDEGLIPTHRSEDSQRRKLLYISIGTMAVLIIVSFSYYYFIKARTGSPFHHAQTQSTQNPPQADSSTGNTNSPSVTIISMPNPSDTKNTSSPDTTNNTNPESPAGNQIPVEPANPETNPSVTKPVVVPPATQKPEIKPIDAKKPELVPAADDLSTLWSSAQSDFRKRNYTSAAKMWKDYLKKSGNTMTIQVELACESNTIEEALNLLPNKALFYLLPIKFKGKLCYTIGYGVFKGKSQAEEAYKNLPPIFINQQYPPKIVPSSSLLK